jgi:hypothetical protein
LGKDSFVHIASEYHLKYSEVIWTKTFPVNVEKSGVKKNSNVRTLDAMIVQLHTGDRQDRREGEEQL